MPEISVSTNAGGWFHSGMNVKCPIHACKSARDFPNDINKKHLLPIILAVIQEMRSIFSSKYIHLGSDARKESMACFKEAGINPDFLAFEENLAALMEIEGILPRHVVRWANKNNEIYPGRFGSITQCRIGEVCPAANTSETSPWFGTVNLRDGGAWNIYQATRLLALRQPQALLADFDEAHETYFQQHHILHRLLAFAFGATSATALKNRTTFEQEYIVLCQSYFTTIQDRDLCESFATSEAGINEIPFSETEECKRRGCEGRTYTGTQHFFRAEIVPYYSR